MANGGNITYGIKLKVDSTDLTTVKSQIDNLLKTYSSMGDFRKTTGMDFSQIKDHFSNLNTSFGEVSKGVKTIGQAFNESYNMKLGTLNFSKFNEEI